MSILLNLHGYNDSNPRYVSGAMDVMIWYILDMLIHSDKLKPWATI